MLKQFHPLIGMTFKMGTQINIFAVLIILTIHWFADFVCQTDKMAQGKSKNWLDLLDHTFVYSFIFFCCVPFYAISHIGSYVEWSGSLFALITFVCHTIQDYITSRINAKLWADKKVHLLFVFIGFDQLLHFIQLLLTYQLLK